MRIELQDPMYRVKVHYNGGRKRGLEWGQQVEFDVGHEKGQRTLNSSSPRHTTNFCCTHWSSINRFLWKPKVMHINSKNFVVEIIWRSVGVQGTEIEFATPLLHSRATFNISKHRFRSTSSNLSISKLFLLYKYIKIL